MTTRLIVSIHDVAPPHAIEVQHPWELCRSLGITPALFVVPNWHGESPSGESPAFVDWIRERASDGAELFLHGERHDEIGMRHRMSDELRALGRTANEGEFLTLDRWAARARIRRGLMHLWSLGLRPVGFVPPAWLAPRTTHDVVRKTGLGFSEDVSCVYVPDQRRTIAVPAPAVRWSGRTAVRARFSCRVAALQRLRARHTPYLRLALHPQDLGIAVIARSVRKNLLYWANATTPTLYAELGS